MKPSWWMTLAAAVSLLGSGCGDKEGKNSTAKSSQAFQGAPPAVKQLWDNANKAMNSNDYSAAFVMLRSLRTVPNLSGEQSKAVDQTMENWSEKLVSLVEKGDPKAIQAAESLKTMGRR